MNQFKVGDRVKVICNEEGICSSSNSRIKEGMLGTVLAIEDSVPQIGVEFDDNIGGHNLGGVGKCSYCWYMCEESLKRVESKETDSEVDQLCLTIEKAMNRLYEIADSYTLKQAANGIINILQRKSVARLELNRFKKALEDNHDEDM